LSLWLDDFVTALNELLFEVDALAHQLRKTDFHLQQGQGLLAPGRAMLQILAKEGAQTVPSIAAKQNASRQNVQIIANRFAQQGLAEFRTNPGHKKSDLLEITNKGRQVLAASRDREGTMVERLRPGMDEARIATAAELLRRMRQDLGGVRAEAQKLKPVNGEAEQRAVQKPERPAVRSSWPEPDEESLPVNLL
jgi:DNA-binding MarR family transcriptional regulator